MKIDANEPEWIVNLKKSIASQLQLDLSGVRQDGPAVDTSAPKDGQSASLTVFEVNPFSLNILLSTQFQRWSLSGFHLW